MLISHVTRVRGKSNLAIWKTGKSNFIIRPHGGGVAMWTVDLTLITSNGGTTQEDPTLKAHLHGEQVGRWRALAEPQRTPPAERCGSPVSRRMHGHGVHAASQWLAGASIPCFPVTAKPSELFPFH